MSKLLEVGKIEFAKRVLLVPKRSKDERGRIIRSHSAAARMTARGASLDALEIRGAGQKEADLLEKMGVKSQAAVQSVKDVTGGVGVYTLLNSIGLATAALNSEDDFDKMREEFSDDFEVLEDFDVSLPGQPSAQSSSAPLDNAALDNGFWPVESGIAEAWNAGITGKDVLVGVLDTGVDADHDEFSGKTIEYRYLPLTQFRKPRDIRGLDPGGHGTHVCGTITGKKVGVAPDVNLFVASVIESESIGTSISRVIQGLDWLFEKFSSPENASKPGIVNLSLGFPPNPGGIHPSIFETRLEVIRGLVADLQMINVLPVVAIGNEGEGQYRFPGAFEEVLSVGAVDFDGAITNFSGSGGPADSNANPNIVGYGKDLLSSIQRNHAGESLYTKMSGTSMATPYVTGIAALYRSHHPQLNVDETIEMLTATASTDISGDSGRVGNGLARFVPA